MNKTGFIYLWYDRKHRRFYLGKHWGTLDDEYICSSTWMKRAQKRRPQDFKRRILEWVDDRTILGDAERRWGSLIKEPELGKRYYNLLLPAGGGHWHEQDHSRKTVGQKISKTLTGREFTKEHRKNIGKATSKRVGQKRSLESRARISDGVKKHKKTNEHRLALGESQKRVKWKQCPHCGKEAPPSPFVRFHGDKCKQRY